MHVVTGAFGYSGKYLTQRLLEAGKQVRTLTNSTQRHNPFGDKIEVHPFNFDNPAALAESLANAEVLYNTYWVRFNHKLFKHADAVRNTIALFRAAQTAGVKRIVHVSITNPRDDSPWEYFRGKAELERELKATGISYAILRPAVLFGGEDILINNIAWMLRRLPVFGVFGDGNYKLQPIHVEDFAALMAEQGALTDSVTIDAIGPETFSYRDLAATIGTIIGKRRRIISVPPFLGYFVGRVLGFFLNDVVVTRDEIEGLMANLLYTDSPPAGHTRLTDWAAANAETLGVRYANELQRRRDREKSYTKL